MIRMDPLKLNLEEIANGNEENFCPLRGLVKILKALSQRPPVLPEIFYLNEFSQTALFPLIVFNPRWIIERMMTLHGVCMNVIYKNPTYIKTLVYKYNSGEEAEEYVFSNNMMFYADVITICYLYYIVEVHRIELQLAHDLMVIMKRKYFIMDITMSFDLQIITLHKIILSYPSISLGLLHYNILNVFSFTSIIFPDLSNIFNSPWLASIIPVLDSDCKTPLALLLVMATVFDRDNKFSYILYQRMLTLHSSEIFPKSFKLELSRNWGIVYVTENEYKYAPYFTTAHERAVYIISSLKPNDPSLKYTLSNI